MGIVLDNIQDGGTSTEKVLQAASPCQPYGRSHSGVVSKRENFGELLNIVGWGQELSGIDHNYGRNFMYTSLNYGENVALIKHPCHARQTLTRLIGMQLNSLCKSGIIWAIICLLSLCGN